MARLLEFQAKALLRSAGIATPDGAVARSAEEARAAAARLGPCVVKIQASITGRKDIGGVAFPSTPDEAAQHAERMLAMRVGQFPVHDVLVEARVPIEREIFFSLTIDDRQRAPLLLASDVGGTGIEERGGKIARIPCSVSSGPDAAALDAWLAGSSVPPASRADVRAVAVALFRLARDKEARSVEVNPLVILKDGRVMAVDGRVTIDDYAVFRHPDLGIEIARELDHPPTALERVAYRVEQEDHRGTFFFAQMNAAAGAGSKGLVGFHGAGGGGSMMSMDAITNEGFTIANFTDTSGNPSAAKVYRASRIILCQPGLVGYFGSGSGVASQEQFWSAYGLSKAFWELDIDIPVVVRLGGNTEDRAVAILAEAAKLAQAPIEGYRKFDPPASIGRRFAELVAASKASPWTPRAARRPSFVGASTSLHFPVKGGTLWIDPSAWRTHGAAIAARSSGLLRDDGGKPVPTVPPDELANKDSELLACEVECRHAGVDGLFLALDIPGLDAIVAATAATAPTSEGR